MKKNVLFVCVHNSARSQMAEAFLNQACPGMFEAHSAGLEPSTLNPVVVEAMWELGIDISMKRAKWIYDFLAVPKEFSYVITVCDESNAERCPAFPSGGVRLHWSFPDPSVLQGTFEERLAKTREIRDAIRARVETWGVEVCRELGSDQPRERPGTRMED